MTIKNRSETADIFGVHITTLDGWIKRGCPYVKKGTKGVAWEIDTAQVSDWLRANDAEALSKGLDNTDIDEGKRRKIVADATLAEIQVAKEKGIVIDAEEIKQGLSHLFAEFTGKVRRVPERAVLRIVGETNESKIKSVLLEEIDECLNLFTDYVEQRRL